ncbi:hypothetical protein PTKIN_Ptkin01aG0025400 [Pterospermum kingtungense]
MLLIQESKLGKVNDRLLKWLWGNGSFKGAFTMAEGSSGGLISCWDEKLKEMRKVMKDWQEREGLAKLTGITKLEEEIEVIESSFGSGRPWEEVRRELFSKRAELWNLYRMEERAWFQKSRIKWLREKDRNTKFFHMAATMRRRLNAIDHLEVNGALCSDPRVVKQVIVAYFEAQIQANFAIPLRCFDCTFRQLKESSVLELEKPFTEQKVWEVIQNSDRNKAPGPDGFNLNFYKQH